MKHLFFFLFFAVQLSAQTVYTTPSGRKFHTAGCRMVENVAHAMPVSQAAKNGYLPCKICKPAFSSARTFVSSGVNKAKGTGNTVQCRGTTKSGTRCRHKTSIGNGYCFQHQP